MINSLALKTLISAPEYDGQTAEQILDAVNAQTIAVYPPVSSVDVASYLMVTPSHFFTMENPLSLYNVLSLTYRAPQFSDAVRAIAENVIDMATGVERKVDLKNNPNYAFTFGLMRDAGQFTQEEIDALLSMGKVMISLSEQQFGEMTTLEGVRAALLYDQWLAESATLETMRQAFAAQEFKVNALAAGIVSGGG